MSYLKYPANTFMIGPCYYLPERVISNEALVAWANFDIKPGRISQMTGIESRHWVQDHENLSDLGVQATHRLLEAYAYNPDDLEALMLTTISGEHLTPPTSPLIQHKLGLAHVGCLDIGAACAGFVTGLHTAAPMLACGQKDILLISAEIRSRFLSKDQLAATALFGDGASACILSQNKEKARFQVIASMLLSDGSVADVISVPAGGSKMPASPDTHPNDYFLTMKNGPKIFLAAVKGMRDCIETFLVKLGMGLDDIDHLVPHQANYFMIRELCKKLKWPMDRVTLTISHTGNTSGASCGIALGHLAASVTAGRYILMVSAGGGGLGAVSLLKSL